MHYWYIHWHSSCTDTLCFASSRLVIQNAWMAKGQIWWFVAPKLVGPAGSFPHNHFHVEELILVLMAGHWAWITSKPCGMHLRTFYNVFTFCSHMFNTPFESFCQCFIKRPNQRLKCWDFRSFLNPAEGADDAVMFSLRCCDLGLNRLCNERLVPSSLVAKAAEIQSYLDSETWRIWRSEDTHIILITYAYVYV